MAATSTRREPGTSERILDIAERLVQTRGFNSFSYADIAFYMAQFFAARHTVPITVQYPNLLAWRRRVAQRPAIMTVIGAMVAYLRSLNLPVPELGERPDAR